MATKCKPLPGGIQEALRHHVLESHLSRYRLAQLTGVNQALMCRFAQSGTGLSGAAIDRLCRVLGLALVLADPEKVRRYKNNPRGRPKKEKEDGKDQDPR